MANGFRPIVLASLPGSLGMVDAMMVTGRAA
jgi:hypothetical protein